VAFPATYGAQTGASSFDNSAALNCSNVSCHGGQATPNWQTGALDVNTQCTNCHVSGTTQFNSYNSGEHVFHVNLFGGSAASCTLCHNTATLAVNHFTALATSAMEGPASATVGGTGTVVTTYVAGSCTPQAGIGCHGNRDWQ
jgi:predicted CxxxxCH...CXXCH cytochrome family protein